MRKFLAAAALALAAASAAAQVPGPGQIDAEIRRVMAAAQVKGLAVAVVEDGRVTHVQVFGQRNERGEPLQPQTIMYGASLTKAVFAYTVLQLVDEGLIDLDASIAKYLPQPLPSYPNDRRYAPWFHLQGDERWRLLTPRILLSHHRGLRQVRRRLAAGGGLVGRVTR